VYKYKLKFIFSACTNTIQLMFLGTEVTSWCRDYTSRKWQTPITSSRMNAGWRKEAVMPTRR